MGAGKAVGEQVLAHLLEPRSIADLGRRQHGVQAALRELERDEERRGGHRDHDDRGQTGRRLPDEERRAHLVPEGGVDLAALVAGGDGRPCLVQHLDGSVADPVAAVRRPALQSVDHAVLPCLTRLLVATAKSTRRW